MSLIADCIVESRSSEDPQSSGPVIEVAVASRTGNDPCGLLRWLLHSLQY